MNVFVSHLFENTPFGTASPRDFSPETRENCGMQLDQTSERLLALGDNHGLILRSMIVDGQALGALFIDARLAAWMTEYGGGLHTTDRLRAFRGLRKTKPFA
jgi:hypothetical protein